MQPEELLRLQKYFRLGTKWGEIAFAKEWLRPHETEAFGLFYLAETFRKHAATEDEAQLAYTTCLRMVLLCFCVESHSGRRSLLDVSSIKGFLMTYWIPFAKKALQKLPREDGGLLSRLNMGEITFTSDGSKRRTFTEFRRFENFVFRGLWWDLMQETPLPKGETTNKKPKREPSQKAKPDPFRPLPDEFVLETGKRAAWLVRQVMPQAVRAYADVLPLSVDVSENTGTAYICKYLREFEWDLSDNPVPGSCPVDLRIKSDDKRPWPPQDRNQLNRLLLVCQMAAYFVVALSSGPRAGELLSIQNDCLTESSEGITLLNGRIYKLEALFEGKKRDWPMPALGLQAVQTQIELSKVLDRAMIVERARRRRSTSLWRVFGGSSQGNPLNYQYNEYIREFTDRIGTSHLLDDESLTNHRFRKTIARLVALAMVNAPKILMDIFGHKDIAMTMHYILTDNRVRAEIMRIQKELLAMRVEKAIANVDSNGGPGANKIKAEVKRIKFIRAREDLQAEDVRELVVRMTSVGREWTIVVPGVICTKMRDQVGPCALGCSTPNPSKCSFECQHRLEEADNISQVNSTLAYIVKNIKAALAQNNVVQIDALEGQLFSNLKRYDVLYRKWSTDSIVAAILARNLEEATNAG